MLQQAGDELYDLFRLFPICGGDGPGRGCRLDRLGFCLRRGRGLGGGGGFGRRSRGRRLLYGDLLGFIGGLVGHLHLGRTASDAQKTGLGPLQDLHGDLVPIHTQLGQGGLDGGVLGPAGAFNPFQHWVYLSL